MAPLCLRLTRQRDISIPKSYVKSVCRALLIGLFASLTVVASNARAGIVLSTLAESPSSLSSIGVPWLGQRFVTGLSSDWLLNSVSVSLHDTQDSTSPLFVSIYSNSGSNKPDVELGRFLTGTFPPTTSGVYSYGGYDGDLLTASTSYWLVLGADTSDGYDGSDPTQYLWWDTASSSYSSADSWHIPATNNTALSFYGFTWYGSSETPYLFSVDATAVPEPGTWAAAALLAGGAAFMRWRKRAKLACLSRQTLRYECHA